MKANKEKYHLFQIDNENSIINAMGNVIEKRKK